MLLTQTRPRTSLQPYLHQQHPSQGLSHHQESAFNASRQATRFYPDNSDFDFDADYNLPSLSSSPVSTQSVLSQYSGSIQASPLSTFDSIPTISVPRGAQEGSLFGFPQSNETALGDAASSLLAANNNIDLMLTDSWLPNNGQLTPRSAGRVSHHHRESSLSSLGSAGPASPYSHNTSNPQIAVTDSGTDGFHGMSHNTEDFYQLAKGFPHDTFYANYPHYASADTAAMSAYSQVAAAPKRKMDRGLLPPPEHPIGGSNRSRPVSVASSITSDSPATPSGEPDEDRRRTNVVNPVPVPKLDRTMTDVYGDELYNPNFTITSASTGQIPVSPSNEIFTQRLQAANQHLSVAQSPVSATSRDRSPFRTNSPLAPAAMHDFSSNVGSPHQMRFGSAQQLREHNKALQDAHALQQQIARSRDTGTPQTISPKDALLEFHEPENGANFPLFPQQRQNEFDTDAISKAVAQNQASFNLDAATIDNYLASQNMVSQLPLQIPQQYPFIAQPQQRQPSNVPSLSNGSLPTSRMGSADVGATDSASNTSSPQRPPATNADGGTYTCTYHGCTLRFETPALLQKHKREGHRQAHGLNGSRRPDVASVGMTSSLINSQAGPHRCDRINPSTGKPCKAVFSRPYDLTRHEDTIHNARKQKVRCDLCTDEKTFSRADALTRHYRVCHPEVEFPGKQRRRGGHSG
jgi:hypothetical protein